MARRVNVSVLKKLDWKELSRLPVTKLDMKSFPKKPMTALLTFSLGVVFNFAWINIFVNNAATESKCEEFVAVGLETEKIYRVTRLNPIKIPEETMRVCEDEIVLRPKD